MSATLRSGLPRGRRAYEAADAVPFGGRAVVRKVSMSGERAGSAPGEPAGRDRHGRDAPGHPRARLVLAGEHRRLGAHPPGQGGPARPDALARRLGRRPRLRLRAEPPLPAPRRRALHPRREAALRVRRGPGRARPAGSLPGGGRGPARQGGAHRRGRALRRLPQPPGCGARRRRARASSRAPQRDDRRFGQALRDQARRAARGDLDQARPGAT